MDTPHTPRPTPRRQRGVTLIESAVATAVVAVAAGSVVPGLTKLRAHQAVAGAAAEFETDVQHARSLAVSTGTTWRISFENGDAGSCYVIHTGAAGSCPCLTAGSTMCADGTQALKSARFGSGANVALTSNVPSMAFDSIKGTSTPTGTVKVAARDGAAVHQIVNVMGRVRSCSPGLSITGYKAC